MSESSERSNGHEIKETAPVLSAGELVRRLDTEFGINGESPTERIEQLKRLSVEGIAILLEDINKSVQGSAESLMNHDTVMKIGEQETLKPEDRYDVFSRLVIDIKNASADVSPQRVADVLAPGTVLLHPFHDGNGRTARVLGLVFRDGFGGAEYESDFTTVAESRDDARQRGGFMIYGYTPRFSEGFDQSDPRQVSEYLSGLLTSESPDAYLSPYGPVPLHAVTA